MGKPSRSDHAAPERPGGSNKSGDAIKNHT